MRSPELARLLALKGARILFQPTAYFHPDGLDIRRRYLGKCCSQRARAMENGVHLVTANIGRREYVNNSRVIAPDNQGPEKVLARATRKEQLLVADIPVPVDKNRARERVAGHPELYRELGRTLLELTG
jgi:predicted amidohydrolase